MMERFSPARLALRFRPTGGKRLNPACAGLVDSGVVLPIAWSGLTGPARRSKWTHHSALPVRRFANVCERESGPHPAVVCGEVPSLAGKAGPATNRSLTRVAQVAMQQIGKYCAVYAPKASNGRHNDTAAEPLPNFRAQI
jgi:hypothetical protein